MIGFGKPTFDICPGGLAFNGTPFQTVLPSGVGYGPAPPTAHSPHAPRHETTRLVYSAGLAASERT